MNTKKKKVEKPPMKYWLVEFTLTSGRVQTFYVKARFQHDAYQKADEYAVLAENEKICQMLSTFKLMV